MRMKCDSGWKGTLKYVKCFMILNCYIFSGFYYCNRNSRTILRYDCLTDIFIIKSSMRLMFISLLE